MNKPCSSFVTLDEKPILVSSLAFGSLLCSHLNVIGLCPHELCSVFRPYVDTFTMKRNAATNRLVIFVEDDDMTSRSYEVMVKVDLKVYLLRFC